MAAISKQQCKCLIVFSCVRSSHVAAFVILCEMWGLRCRRQHPELMRNRAPNRPYDMSVVDLWDRFVRFVRLVREAEPIRRLGNEVASKWKRLFVKMMRVRRLQRYWAYMGHFLQTFGWTPQWRKRLSDHFPLV